MGGINKDKLVFDTSVGLDENDNIGSFIRSSDGTLITHTTVSGKEGLDVNLVNTSIAVTSTDLDIRDLAFATDKVDVSGSEVSLDATTLAALENITVSATDLDIRNLVFATDKVDVSGSEVSLDATTLAALENITVSATDLDIRNLDYSQDNVAIKGSTGNQLVVNADGSINANVDVSVVSGAEKAEDSAHTSGDIGQFMLAVRHDADTSMVSADGDYAPLQVNAAGALKVAGSLSISAPTASVTQAINVGTTAVLIPTTALTGRKKLLIQSLSSKAVYLGETGVTSSTGIRLAAGANMEIEAGPGLDVYLIGTVATNDIRIREVN